MNTTVIALYAVAAGMIITGAVLWTRTQSFLRHAVKTNGTIIRIEKQLGSGAGDYSVYYYPVFEYDTIDGQRIKISDVGSNPSPYKVGQSIRVLYDPARPDSVRINSWFQIWGGAAICLGVEIMFAIVGYIFAAAALHQT